MAHAAGRLIRCSAGYSAFVPNPLPADRAWGPKVVAALSDADRLIGRLAGEGARLPNPHLLMRPFLRREAVLSSRIEGTQATLGELLAAEAGALVDRSPEDLREVGNYVAALEHGLKRLAELPLSLRLVKELHVVLMEGVRGGHATPGEFRRSQNWIGPPGCTPTTATFIPPPPEELMSCLGEWESALRETTIPPLIHAGLVHYQFEAIHPFLDGNGRVGRLLITLLLVERKVLATPLLYLSAFFEATRRDYYERLLHVSLHNEWEAWIEYFLNGISRQSEDALSRVERINHLLEQWRAKVAEMSAKTPSLVLDLLAANPFITAKQVAERLGVAFTTAQRAIKKLKEASIVEVVGHARRGRVYCAKAILDILEEPAKLSPTE